MPSEDTCQHDWVWSNWTDSWVCMNRCGVDGGDDDAPFTATRTSAARGEK